MSRYDAQRMVIRTPEGVEFGLVLAGPVSRFLAWLVDTACLALAAMVLSMILSTFIPFQGDLMAGLFALTLYVLFTGYRIVAEWVMRGQTIGKRLLRLRVIDAQGLRLGFSQVAVRNLLRFVDAMPLLYFVGGLLSVLSRRCQRLGDLAANTVVVREETFAAPNLEKALPGKFNSLKSHPHLAARLRQRVSPETAKLALQALQRRESLSPEARVALFGELAEYIKSLTVFPEDATFGISDENYVRNVVDVVFSGRKPAMRDAPRATAGKELEEDGSLPTSP